MKKIPLANNEALEKMALEKKNAIQTINSDLAKSIANRNNQRDNQIQQFTTDQNEKAAADIEKLTTKGSDSMQEQILAVLAKQLAELHQRENAASKSSIDGHEKLIAVMKSIMDSEPWISEVIQANGFPICGQQLANVRKKVAELYRTYSEMWEFWCEPSVVNYFKTRFGLPELIKLPDTKQEPTSTLKAV